MGDIFIGLLNSIIKNLADFLKTEIDILHASPFQAVNNSDVSSFLGTLNWFIPVSQMVAIGETWLVAVGLYYLYSIVLRWIKAIQ